MIQVSSSLFRYFLKELIPHFITSFCVLSSVIVISQLVSISETLFAFGFSLENLLLPFLFMLIPFMSLTIPMAYMFAVLLTFSRLSSDGEYSAMLAVGYSIKRMAVPVIVMGGILFAVSVYCSLYFEPWGRRATIEFRQRKAQTELDNILRIQLKPEVFLNDFLGYVLYAEKISSDRTFLENVMIAPGNKKSDQHFVVTASNAQISGSVESGTLMMEVRGGIVSSISPRSSNLSIMKFKQAKLDLIKIFQEQIFGADIDKNDLRAFYPSVLITYVKGLKNETDPRLVKEYFRADYLLHQRFGMAFSIMGFALIAMVLGTFDERKGRNFGYIGTIIAIIINYVVVMWFKSIAEKGTLAALLGVWIPNILLLLIGVLFVYQRNRLPPSEPPLHPKNLPFFGKFYSKLRQYKVKIS